MEKEEIKQKPQLKMIAFIEDGNIKSAYDYPSMEKQELGILILELDILIEELKKKYLDSSEIIVESEDK